MIAQSLVGVVASLSRGPHASGASTIGPCGRIVCGAALDLGTLRVLADRVAVMYLGSVVEIGPRDDIYDAPKHPYTRALLSAIPIPDPAVQRARRRIALTGDIPSPLETPPGCPFHSRCPDALAKCAATRPEPVLVGQTAIACHLFEGQPAG